MEKNQKSIGQMLEDGVLNAQVWAVLNFLYADQNIRKDNLIMKSLLGHVTTSTIVDYEGIFKELNYDLNKFIFVVPEIISGRVITYILKNYKGLTVERARIDFLGDEP